MRRTLSAIIVSLTTATTVALAPATAVAGSSVTINSTNNSAQAQFHDYGEHLYACDLSADGLRAVAIAEWNSGSYEVQDTDGANGNCAGHVNLNITDGTTVTIWACARNGATGTLQYCNWAYATA